MNKKAYYLFKEILPNFLLTILFILLFDVLNYRTDITNSKYVIYFAFFFTLFNYLINLIINVFQVKRISRIPISEVILNESHKILYIFFVFKLIKMLTTISLFALLSMYYKENIVFESIFTPILIGSIIEILKIILNNIFKFDKIIMLNENRKEFKDDLDELIEDLLKEEDMTKKIHSQEKQRKTSANLEKFMKQTHDPIEKEEDEE